MGGSWRFKLVFVSKVVFDEETVDDEVVGVDEDEGVGEGEDGVVGEGEDCVVVAKARGNTAGARIARGSV